jgi:hypothetical protein
VKPLEDYTLSEVKTLCAGREDCTGCPFENLNAYDHNVCILAKIPAMYKLNKGEETN